MRMGFDVYQEQNQKLIMTPELRLAIKVLQYSAVELTEYINQQMAENPVLEIKEERPEVTEQVESEKTVEEKYDIDWQEYFADSSDLGYQRNLKTQTDEYNYEHFVSKSPNLQEHLLFQLSLTKLTQIQEKIAEYLIGNIDEHGFLGVSLDETAHKFSLPLDEIKSVVRVIQTFEPSGVGARDLTESLLIQAEQLEILNPLVEKLIKSYLPELAKGRFAKIARQLDVSDQEVRQAFHVIKQLDPKPGRNFSGINEVRYIVPDIVIKRIDGEYVILVNDTSVPRLTLNNAYRDMLKRNAEGDTKEYIEKKLNSALWLVKSIEQRRVTLYKVAQALVEVQRDFLEHGVRHLKPLTLKDVANKIQVHESTVSRATSNKYAETPQGVFELKYFFSSGVENQSGVKVSSESIKNMIADLINTEDNRRPLSDQKICDFLNEKGIKISRRTVAKYRDELRLPPASMRKYE